jgi:Ricin-type beta-trefoil lectin domain
MDGFAGTPERAATVAVSASSPVIIAKAYTANLVAVVQDASKENFTPVILWPYSASEATFTPWSLHDLGDGSYQVVPGTNPTGCLDAAHGSMDDGGQVIQYDWHNGLNQKWRLLPRADGFLAFVSAQSGKCITAHGGPAQGLQLTQYGRDDTSRDQAWALVL